MRKCTHCSGDIQKDIHALSLYCSDKCRYLAAKSRRKLVEKICPNPNCKINFLANDYRQKFCSKSCSASFHNPRTKRKFREFVECRLCDKKLSKSQNSFCSHLCRVSFDSFMRNNDWVEGYIAASTDQGQLCNWARNILLEMCDHTCECGWNTPNPLIGKPILTIDHIDGNWKNNYCWNLRVLCYNCHTLTPTFGSLNRGSVSGRRNYKFIRP